MKFNETNGAQYWVFLGSDPSQALQAHFEEQWVKSFSMALAALMPLQISRIAPYVLFSWFCPHSDDSISGAFIYMKISVISSNLSICYQNFHMPWFWAELHGHFSNSGVFSAVLVHQSQSPNTQLFIIGMPLFQEKVSPLNFTHLTHLLWFWYSLAAYCSCLEISTLQLPLTVRFGLLQPMSRFVHISSCPFPLCGLAQLCEMLYWCCTVLCTFLLTCFHLVLCCTAQGMVKRLCFCFHISWAVVKPSD